MAISAYLTSFDHVCVEVLACPSTSKIAAASAWRYTQNAGGFAFAEPLEAPSWIQRLRIMVQRVLESQPDVRGVRQIPRPRVF